MYVQDQLAALKMQAPACYVININTQPITSPGEHWVAIYMMENQNGVYFDSLGIAPEHPDITKFLQKHTKRWFRLTKMIQDSITVVCGEYCIVFSVHLKKKF